MRRAPLFSLLGPLLGLLLGLLLPGACARQPEPARTWRDAPPPVEITGSPLLLERLGNAYFADGRYEAAARRFAALLAQRPGHAPAALYLGLCQWLSGRPDLARATWRESAPRLAELRPVFGRLAAGLTLLEYRLQARRAAGGELPDLRLGRVALLPPSGSLARGPQGKALHQLTVDALRRDCGVNAVPRERLRAFLDETGADPAEDRAAALRLAGRLGAEYAVQWRVEPGRAGGVRVDFLLLGVESPDGRMVRLAEELAATRGQLASLEAGLAAAHRELEAMDTALAHQELSEKMDRLLDERAPQAEKVSTLLRAGRMAEAKEALAELHALETKIEEAYRQQLAYRHTAYELFLGLYRPTPEILRSRREVLAGRADALAAQAAALRERTAFLQAQVDSPLPGTGRPLAAEVPDGEFLPTHIPAQAARVLAAALGRTARPGLPRDLGDPGDPLGREALAALGRALAAMDNAEYAEAEAAFAAARSLEPTPPDLPWPGFDPLALSRMPPGEVTAAFAGYFHQAVDRLREESARRGEPAADFAARQAGS